MAWGVSAALSLLAASHALLMKRDPRSALGWIVVSLWFPLIGPLLYWLMGINRITRTARRWKESGRRLSSHDAFQAPHQTKFPSPIVGDTFHLKELRLLSDRIVTTSLTAGNRLAAFHNGDQAYPAMLEAIASARHSIHLSTYIFDGDRTGKSFVEALCAAAARGVEVRVIVDGLGEKYSNPTARKLLRGSAVEIARFLPMRQGGHLNLRNHRKMLIIDGRAGFTGGMNIGSRHMVGRPETSSPVVDMHFKVEGPVVADLQKVFLEDWFFVTGDFHDEERFFPPLPAAGTAHVRAIADGPDKGFRKLFWIVMGALSCAGERVQIMTPYFIPDRALISALITTAMRGVEVTLILPARNNLPLVHWATRSYLWELLQCGIRIYYQPPPFVHTKLFLVDGLWTLIGSANLDPRSLRLNFELNLETYDCQFTGLLEKHYLETLSRSREITLDELDGRPLAEKLRDGAAKLFSPYL
ncbi:MAG: cardiolipin synthase [Deltaproteobacteria bacterium]|nr:cardiolipin synthase [Deltaproteobacteria bacterium]